MISAIKNNIKKDSNPKVEFLNRFSSVVNKKIEEKVNSKKEKAFYDNVFFIMTYGISLLLIAGSLSALFSLFSTAFIFSMFPKDIHEVFKGLISFFYLIFSFSFVFIACRYSHNLVVVVSKRVPFLKNITNYFSEKNKIRDESLDYFLKEKMVPVSSKQIDFMDKVIEKMDEKTTEKILSGLKKESPNVMSKLKTIFNKILKNEELEINEKIFVMAKLSDIKTSNYDVVFDLLNNNTTKSQ